MKRTLLGAGVLAFLLLPAARAHAVGIMCSNNAASSGRFCSLSSSSLGLTNRLPTFILPDTQTLDPVSSLSSLNFTASFLRRGFVSASLIEGFNSGASEPGRQGNDAGYGRTGSSAGFFAAGIPNINFWYHRPVGDQAWYHRHFIWNFGSNGMGNTNWLEDPSPLAETPEPVSFVLFGTGLLLIALEVRRRADIARNDT